MIPPNLFFNNIWRRFFNFLGPFNYENLLGHYCYKLESPSESKDSPPLHCLCAPLFPSSLPSRSYGSFSVEDREDGGREKGKVSFLRYTALQAPLAADVFCMAGIQILTGLQIWARTLVGTGISISLVRRQDSGFTGGSIPAPCLTQVWLHFPSLKPHAYDSFPGSVITWADICLCTNGCSAFEFSISTTCRKSDPVDLRKDPDILILKNAHQISLYYELNCVPQTQIQMLKS